MDELQEDKDAAIENTEELENKENISNDKENDMNTENVKEESKAKEDEGLNEEISPMDAKKDEMKTPDHKDEIQNENDAKETEKEVKGNEEPVKDGHINNITNNDTVDVKQPPSDSQINLPEQIVNSEPEQKLSEENENEFSQVEVKSQKTKKIKKSIFLSYSPDAGYLERKFVVQTVREFKENNLAEDIWFDKDEKNIDNPCWFSLRLEAAEKCKAAILILSDSYFMCPVSIYEGKVLLDRYRRDKNSVKIFTILWSKLEETEMPTQFDCLTQNMVDLTHNDHRKLSLSEKTSVVVGALMVDVENFATVLVPPSTPVGPFEEPSDGFKRKKICHWAVNDLQDWLYALQIKEFYRQSLAESMIDGFLLMSLTEQDMIQHLGIDSPPVRKKIMKQILIALDKEHKLEENWHLRVRTLRSKPQSLYIIYDPTDVRLTQSLKKDLSRKGISVIHHQNLGQSKDEFLQRNGSTMAQSQHVLVLMTDSAVNSPFVFHEIMFAEWLGKKVVTAVFRNTWDQLRPSMKAVLGENVAIDFESKMYSESMDVLEHHIKPMRVFPGVVLEQSYLNKMAEGLQPFCVLANESPTATDDDENEPKIFISYQWDVQSKVEELRRVLEANGFTCWADISTNIMPNRSQSSASNRSGNSTESTSETLKGKLQRVMKSSSVVLCCITPKYMQSDNCSKDLSLADGLRKPIVPVMLRYTPWPPDSHSPHVRKILRRFLPVDMSNDKLYKKNLLKVLDSVDKIISQRK